MKSVVHLVLFLILSLAVRTTCAEPVPEISSTADRESRRKEIHRELERNIDTIRELFELIDQIPEGEEETHEFYDSQIQQFDDRSEVLHEELDEIEKFEFLANREIELDQEATRLEHEAKQLRDANRLVPAAMREGRAKSIRGMLADGTWRLTEEDEWTGDTPGGDLATVLQMNSEIEKLKQETTILQQQVKQLRETVERLEAKLNAKD